jgi:hypothetical protein
MSLLCSVDFEGVFACCEIVACVCPAFGWVEIAEFFGGCHECQVFLNLFDRCRIHQFPTITYFVLKSSSRQYVKYSLMINWLFPLLDLYLGLDYFVSTQIFVKVSL